MAKHEIQLDGAEVTVVKALGLGSNEVTGEVLIERCKELDTYELMDTVKGLMDLGYVDGESQTFYGEKEFSRLGFRVNSGYSKALREALDPRDEPRRKSKRVRRE